MSSLLCVICLLVPSPRIIEDPMDTKRPVTQTAVLVCVGQGYGFVDVSWFKGRGKRRNPIPNTSTVTTMVTPDNITSILTISNLTNNDGGKYKCIYNNSGGEMQSSIATLTIGSKCSHIMIISLYSYFM